MMDHRARAVIHASSRRAVAQPPARAVSRRRTLRSLICCCCCGTRDDRRHRTCLEPRPAGSRAALPARAEGLGGSQLAGTPATCQRSCPHYVFRGSRAHAPTYAVHTRASEEVTTGVWREHIDVVAWSTHSRTTRAGRTLRRAVLVGARCHTCPTHVRGRWAARLSRKGSHR
jgi:hypothetical protein